MHATLNINHQSRKVESFYLAIFLLKNHVLLQAFLSFSFSLLTLRLFQYNNHTMSSRKKKQTKGKNDSTNPYLFFSSYSSSKPWPLTLSLLALLSLILSHYFYLSLSLSLGRPKWGVIVQGIYRLNFQEWFEKTFASVHCPRWYFYSTNLWPSLQKYNLGQPKSHHMADNNVCNFS